MKTSTKLFRLSTIATVILAVGILFSLTKCKKDVVVVVVPVHDTVSGAAILGLAQYPGLNND